MQRATIADSAYRYSEQSPTANILLFSHVFTDPSESNANLAAHLEARIGDLPRLRRRLIAGYGSIGESYWSESREFDAADHVVFHHASTISELSYQLEELARTKIDWRRPPWEIHAFRGVDGAPFGSPSVLVVVFKFHHCLGDAMSLEEVFTGLFSGIRATAGLRSKPDMFAPVRVTLRGAFELPIRPILIASDLIRLRRALRRSRDIVGNDVCEQPKPTPRNAITAPPGANISFGVVTVSAKEMKQTSAAIGGVSVNDLVIATIGRTLHDYLGGPNYGLGAAIPVSTRSVDRSDALNSVSTAHISMFTSHSVAEQARRIRGSIQARRRELLSPEHSAVRASLPRLPGLGYRLILSGLRALAPRDAAVTTHTSISTLPRVDAKDWLLGGATPIARLYFGGLSDPHGTRHFSTVIDDTQTITVSADPNQLDVAKYTRTLQANLDGLIKSFASHRHSPSAG